MLLYSPSKCSFTLSKLIRNAWFFLLAARHRMQALSALACCVGCAFGGFASLKTALFIQLLTNEGALDDSFGHPRFFYALSFQIPQKIRQLYYLTKFNCENKPFQAFLAAFFLCVFLSGSKKRTNSFLLENYFLPLQSKMDYGVHL